MKFKDHYIGDSKGGTDIFSFLSIRKGMIEYGPKLDFKEAFKLITEVSLESDKNPKLTKLYKELQSLEYTKERIEDIHNELIKTLETAKAVLEKLDVQCQELTEPKVDKKI